MSAERLRRPSGVSEQGLLGTRGCDHPHEALRTPGAAQHLHPSLCLRGLDQEGHGDVVDKENAIPTGTDQICSALNTSHSLNHITLLLTQVSLLH